MLIGPILRALRHNRLGALLLSLQIALTLAILCNSLSIIGVYISHTHTPSGLDEESLLVVSNTWVGKQDDLKARVAADVAVLRALPGVVGVQATNGFPLGGGGWSTGSSLKPDQRQSTAQTTEYFVDEHGLATYGLTLTAGRWFTAVEVGDLVVNPSSSPEFSPPTTVVTRRLAESLFPGGDALGQPVYINGAAPSRIVGIVDRAQSPWAATHWSQSDSENSMFLPYRFLNGSLVYVIRASAKDLNAAKRAAPDALYRVTRQRIIRRVETFGEVRRQAYQAERSFSITLGILCGLLMTVTACGIVGLTQYWVAQRRRQIGMRRALGARRRDILRYFQTENLLITVAGCIFGIGLGMAGNLWLVSHLALSRMSATYAGTGAAMMLLLCQSAVLWPALRAALISPAIAFRGL